jgi:hypothetical protein
MELVCLQTSKTETEFSRRNFVLSKTRRWVMSRNVIVMLIYHRHRPIEGNNEITLQIEKYGLKRDVKFYLVVKFEHAHKLHIKHRYCLSEYISTMMQTSSCFSSFHPLKCRVSISNRPRNLCFSYAINQSYQHTTF